MTGVGLWLLVFAGAFVGYAYVGYPALLAAVARLKQRPGPPGGPPADWPLVTITLAMYNEEKQAAELLDSLIAIDYPPDRRQILVVSDGSTDGTDAIVQRYAGQGVELLRRSERAGKTAAENAATPLVRGGIVVNTDASIRILPGALKPLIAAFADAEVGLSSGRDVSVSRTDGPANLGESGYVGYEMWIRDLETAVHGIVGASGCFYAIRLDLHRIPVPPHLSRDFAAALKCEENGYRAVSVSDAVCLVPRTASLKKEYGRKVRTFTRGMQTLFHRRRLLNPLRHGVFAWMLFSHKVCRWAVPWAGLLGLVALLLLASTRPWAAVLLGFGAVGVVLGLIGWALGDGRPLPYLLQLPGFALAGNVAAIHALLRAIRGSKDAVWEPTRREKRGSDGDAPVGP
jgi:cellulose synthase/poly-beta-1,6-N-acetylglucosamine synthase-like glycosyltransferase